MDTVAPLIQQWPPWLAALVLGLGWLLHGTGIVGHLFGARQHRELVADREAERGTVDWRAFTTVLTTELGEVRRRHASDIADYDRRLGEAHREVTDERTNAMRWRHLVGSMGAHIVVQRRAMEKAGIEPPRFTWDKFIEEGGDPNEFEGIE